MTFVESNTTYLLIPKTDKLIDSNRTDRVRVDTLQARLHVRLCVTGRFIQLLLLLLLLLLLAIRALGAGADCHCDSGADSRITMRCLIPCRGQQLIARRSPFVPAPKAANNGTQKSRTFIINH